MAMMARGLFMGITAGCLLLWSAHHAVAQSMGDLLHLQRYTAHRASSADPSGGNLDMRRVEAGSTLTLAELQGPGAITHIWFTYMYPSRSALRKLVLRIYFDDLAEPCVEAPLGDFFGLGHAQTYAYASQPLAVGTHSGLNCYWLMPFAKNARLTMTNDGAQDCLALYYQIDYRKLDAPLPDDLHFHAAYRQAFPCEKGKPYLILQTDGGPGHFAGCNLSVEQRDESWWGEGDVRMYVDGETAPSVAGTGSEDDFGGAWCYSHEFSYPQFGAPLRGRFNREGILEHCTHDLRGKDLGQWRWPEAWKPGDLWNVYRYHIADPVPFRKSVMVNIEHGWQGNERSDWYSSVAYWYQAGKPSSRAALPAIRDRLPGWLRPHDHGGGRWEGEDLVDVAKPTAGQVQEAGMEFWGDLFSQQYALQWEAKSSGDTLALPFAVSKPGRYRVTARLSRTEAGGKFRLALDDLTATEPIDLYQPPPFPGLFEVLVAESDLKAGDHVIKCTSLDPQEQSKGRRLLLDKLEVSQAATTQPATGGRGALPLQGEPTKVAAKSAQTLRKIEASITKVFVDDVVSVFAYLMCEREIVSIHVAPASDAFHQRAHIWFCGSPDSMVPVVAEDGLKLCEESQDEGDLEVLGAAPQLMIGDTLGRSRFEETGLIVQVSQDLRDGESSGFEFVADSTEYVKGCRPGHIS